MTADQVGNFGNVISGPVRIQIYNYMYRKGLHSYSRSIANRTNFICQRYFARVDDQFVTYLL